MKKLKQAKVHTVRTNARVRFNPHLIKVVLSSVDPTMAPMYLCKRRECGKKKGMKGGGMVV